MGLGLARAAVKFAGAVFRRAGASAVYPGWAARAEVCERCPLRVVAGNVSYCGQPYYRKPLRDDAEDGCGCPTREKAKDPDEHCPLTARTEASAAHSDAPLSACRCKWCANLPRSV